MVLTGIQLKNKINEVWVVAREMCIGMGMLGTSKIQKDFEKGLSWFRINNGKAYMALLD